MTYVFIVSRGERGEGSSVVGVYSDEAEATEVALSQQDCEEWRLEPKLFEHGGNKVTVWGNGYEYVKVVRHQVQ
jgi:hypothetical protein